ncbi:MAG: hypothetical protein ABIF22_02460 [bacterium]
MKNTGIIKNSKSLISLAEENKLPVHQYMDMETLNWIISLNPFKNKSSLASLFPVESVDLLYKFLPQKKWFLVKDEISTIHGIRHLLRVVVYMIILSPTKELSTQKIINRIIAAGLHDIRRLNDKSDPDHGKRSAEWFLENYKKISEQFGCNLTEYDKDDIYYSIYFHDVEYGVFEKTPEYYKHKPSIDILKTSDALDRYRLPKKKWWFDKKLVKFPVTENIMKFAYEFIINTEMYYLKNLCDTSSVINLLSLDLPRNNHLHNFKKLNFVKFNLFQALNSKVQRKHS